MKKVKIAFVLILLSSVLQLNAGSTTPYCPSGADSRIDHYDGSYGQTGSWVMGYNSPTGLWGSSHCADPGISCHKWDVHTWWFGYAPPPPGEGYTSENVDSPPIGYDVVNNEYIF